MAKSKPSKSSKPTDEVDVCDDVTLDGFALGEPVTIPTFKVPENEPKYFRIDSPIDTKKKTKRGQTELDEDGNERTIATVRVVDLETGELGQIVAGAVLVSSLSAYKGGDYVGRSFRFVKRPAKEGSRAKLWEVREIVQK